MEAACCTDLIFAREGSAAPRRPSTKKIQIEHPLATSTAPMNILAMDAPPRRWPSNGFPVAMEGTSREAIQPGAVAAIAREACWTAVAVPTFDRSRKASSLGGCDGLPLSRERAAKPGDLRRAAADRFRSKETTQIAHARCSDAVAIREAQPRTSQGLVNHKVRSLPAVWRVVRSGEGLG